MTPRQQMALLNPKAQEEALVFDTEEEYQAWQTRRS
jgi:hypothetical protein